MYKINERLVIAGAKLGKPIQTHNTVSIEPNDYKFSDVYKDLHEFLQKLKDIEKQIQAFKEQDDEAIEYIK